MRKRVLSGLFAIGVLVLVGVVVWRVGEEQRRKVLVLPDGSRITYLGATYGRVHSVGELRFQWGWPPIAVLHHRCSTLDDMLYLWFCVEVRAARGMFTYLFPAVTADQRTVTPLAEIVSERAHPAGGRVYIVAVAYEGLPADGRSVRVRVHNILQLERCVGELQVALPCAPIVRRITRPEPLPAVRQGSTLKVSLRGLRWLYSRMDSNTRNVLPWQNPETVYAIPQWLIEAREGDLEDWEPRRALLAPLSAARPRFECNNASWQTAASSIQIPVEGNLDAKVYSLFVEFQHKQTGRREAFEFYVAPPPVEQLRRLNVLETQAREAMRAQHYARVVHLWEDAEREFPLEAHYWRGYAYALQGDYKRAIQEFERALPHLQGTHPFYESSYEVRFALVCCLLLEAQHAKAVQVARECLLQVHQLKAFQWWIDDIAAQLATIVPEAMPSDAQIAQRTRNWTHEARFRQNYFILDGLYRVRAVQAARRGEHQRAIRLLQKGRKHHRSLADALLLAAWHRASGQRAQARKWLRTAHHDCAATPAERRGYAMFWNTVLAGRVLFPDEWKL